MYKDILKEFSEKSNPAIVAIANAASRMPLSTKALWATRLNHVYGDMNGQRAVNFPEIIPQSYRRKIADTPDQTDLVISLEVYYALVCLLIASASLKKSPSNFVEQFFSGNEKDTMRRLSDLLDGKYFEQFGIYGFRNAFDFDWLPETLSAKETEILANALSTIGLFWESEKLVIEGVDPLQKLHKILLPKNLMHITGQFYSPEWLAELLIEDVGYIGEGRLIDPFCGSGVFILVALRKALSNGLPLQEALDSVLGIDLNPSACVAARCNLVTQISQLQREFKEPINLNILNADSIAPAIRKGRKHSKTLFDDVDKLSVDGETIPLTDILLKKPGRYTDALSGYGLKLSAWSREPSSVHSGTMKMNSRERRIMEQLFLYNIKPADFLLTNPPWVGWEYMSRPYRSEIQPAWDAYQLFNAKGLDAAFLKEDLSTLAMMSAWDLYLAPSGKSAAILKPSTMRASLTGRGIRRLSIEANSKPLRLEKVREFEKMKVFSDAQTETCSWIVCKDEATNFPVPVTIWAQNKRGWAPESSENIELVRSNVKESSFLLERTDPDDPGSRWLIAEEKHLGDLSAIKGNNSFTSRMGVFTGGANAVFYLEMIEKKDGTNSVSKWSNILQRAKRAAPKREFYLEDQVVKSVARGRDIEMWLCEPEVFMLFPHTSESKMYPIPEEIISDKYPLAWKYLEESAEILRSRKGFAGWEKKIHQNYFYTLQRIGEYTFSPYKVCWKYISREFTVCVFGDQPNETALIPNDKVMFIPFDDVYEAFYVGGILSSNIVRRYVHSCMSSRQISTSIIKNIYIPDFKDADLIQKHISDLCREGHRLARKRQFSNVRNIRKELDAEVEALYNSLSKNCGTTVKSGLCPS